MRSIANGQLDGFPPKDELRTVYVEHDIDASESNVPVVEYVYSDPILQDASHPAHTQVSEVLGSVGFTEAMQQAPVSSLSGGWKMKLALGESLLCGCTLASVAAHDFLYDFRLCLLQEPRKVQTSCVLSLCLLQTPCKIQTMSNVPSMSTDSLHKC